MEPSTFCLLTRKMIIFRYTEINLHFMYDLWCVSGLTLNSSLPENFLKEVSVLILCGQCGDTFYHLRLQHFFFMFLFNPDMAHFQIRNFFYQGPHANCIDFRSSAISQTFHFKVESNISQTLFSRTSRSLSSVRKR